MDISILIQFCRLCSCRVLSPISVKSQYVRCCRDEPEKEMQGGDGEGEACRTLVWDRAGILAHGHRWTSSRLAEERLPGTPGYAYKCKTSLFAWVQTVT